MPRTWMRRTPTRTQPTLTRRDTSTDFRGALGERQELAQCTGLGAPWSETFSKLCQRMDGHVHIGRRRSDTMRLSARCESSCEWEVLHAAGALTPGCLCSSMFSVWVVLHRAIRR